MAVVCAHCGSPNHVWWDCPKKPAGWKPPKPSSGGSSAVEQTPSKRDVEGSTPSRRSKPIVGRPKNGPTTKSTAARKDGHVGKMAAGDGAHSPSEATAPPETSGHASAKPAGTQAPPVDPPIKRRGRPATGFDKTAYQREYMRERRARLKLAKPNEDQK